MSPAEFKALVRQASASTKKVNPALLPEDLGIATAKDKPTLQAMQTMIAAGIRPTTDEAKLNQTETAYLRYLETQGDFWIGIQCIILKIGYDVRYTPDFAALDRAGLRLIDTKGEHVWEDSKIKIRMAARLFPWIRFVIAKRQGALWHHTEIKP